MLAVAVGISLFWICFIMWQMWRQRPLLTQGPFDGFSYGFHHPELPHLA
jgi:hypothetical protein